MVSPPFCPSAIVGTPASVAGPQGLFIVPNIGPVGASVVTGASVADGASVAAGAAVAGA
ncbi:unannotated protein [freshwater metagenome]|uniref:Unannotated protein n=1 Tax=freshwater metagenome TaxID=449393 RepID=A0A6J7EER3_9ZZZZ